MEESESDISNDQQQSTAAVTSPSVVANKESLGKYSLVRYVSICLLGGVLAVLAIMYSIIGRTTKPSVEKVGSYYYRIVFWFLSFSNVSRIHTTQQQKIIEYETFVMGTEAFRTNWTATDSKSMTFFSTNSISNLQRDPTATTDINGMPLRMPDGLNSYVLFQRPNNDMEYWSVNLTRIYSVIPTYSYRLQFWYTSSSAVSLQVMLDGAAAVSLLPSSSSVFVSWVSANSSTVIAQSSSLIAKFAITSHLTGTKRDVMAVSGIALWEMGPGLSSEPTANQSMEASKHDNQLTAGVTSELTGNQSTEILEHGNQQTTDTSPEPTSNPSSEIREHDIQQTTDTSTEPTTMHMGLETTLDQEQQQTLGRNHRGPGSSVEEQNLWDDDTFWWPWWWTHKPSLAPATVPSLRPSILPTSQPSRQPSRRPSSQPSAHPSRQPSAQPSRQPSQQPTSRPSSQPSRQPTRYDS